MADHTFKAEPDSPSIESTYVFDTPVDEVFAGYTKPELIPEWWAPEGSELQVEKMDVREGGEWRFKFMQGGQGLMFRGVYHTVTKDEKLVGTWGFDPLPSVMLQTTTFERLPDGKTKLTEQFIFQSVEDRAAMMNSGMDEASVLAMMERLAKLL